MSKFWIGVLVGAAGLSALSLIGTAILCYKWWENS